MTLNLGSKLQTSCHSPLLRKLRNIIEIPLINPHIGDLCIHKISQCGPVATTLLFEIETVILVTFREEEIVSVQSAQAMVLSTTGEKRRNAVAHR